MALCQAGDGDLNHRPVGSEYEPLPLCLCHSHTQLLGLTIFSNSDMSQNETWGFSQKNLEEIEGRGINGSHSKISMFCIVLLGWLIAWKDWQGIFLRILKFGRLKGSPYSAYFSPQMEYIVPISTFVWLVVAISILRQAYAENQGIRNLLYFCYCLYFIAVLNVYLKLANAFKESMGGSCEWWQCTAVCLGNLTLSTGNFHTVDSLLSLLFLDLCETRISSRYKCPWMT